MDRIIKDGEQLGPKDHAERVAMFRVQVIGPLLARDFQDHGELAEEIRAIAAKYQRPPGTKLGRQYSAPTIERWYYEYRHGGLEALRPRRRCDSGHARELTEQQRELLLDIRREHPRATTSLIVRTLELDGRLKKGAVSVSTVRRLYKEHDLARQKLDAVDGRIRLRWQADRADALWHSDVCHGPTMKIGERSVPLRIHALLDDHSRYVVAIQAATTEREVEMLALMVKAMRDTGRQPGALYLDNGATYRGDVLATLCSRLGIGLLHAEPGDAQARGKMERFWRTLRQGCLDHIGTPGSLQDVQVRLLAFLGKHYHVSPHASLMGQTPTEVYETAPRDAKGVTDTELGVALTVRGRRRVRADGTVDVGGASFETRAGFLAGKIVTIARSLLDVSSHPWIEHEDARYLLAPVNPEENARRKKEGPMANRSRQGLDVPFDPPGALVDALLKRRPDGDGGPR